MPVKIKTHPALKHGGYAATILLPGEDRTEFERLHRELIEELAPSGPLEQDTVANIAGLVWRKQNLAIFRLAAVAREHCADLLANKLANTTCMLDDEESREIGKITRTASTLAQKQLGDTYELVEAGDSATTNALMADLQVEDRLDARIDKLLKRLLFLRGLKSIPAASSSATPPRISSPTITTA